MPPQAEQDVMIGIMGPTGTGKSSFIRLITGNKDVEIGHSVQSMTSEIGRYNCFTESRRCVTFVDTPGFDDSREGVTDTDILRKIASFLDAEYKDGRKLSGVVYLHRITDPRMGGISNRNLKMFKKLCGEDALKNVIVVTTRWDDVPPKDREAMAKREEELMKTKGKFFEPLIAAGGQYLRHDNTIGSARRIMEKFLDKDPIALQIQVEMKNGKKVEETEAGTELTAEMNKLIEKHTKEMNELRKEMSDAIAEKDEQLRKELEVERARLKGEMEKWESEKKRLAGDLDSVKQAADVAKKDADRKMGEQREEFDRKVRESEAKAGKERRELKAAMDKMEKEKEDANRRLKDLESTKDTADQNNKKLQAQIQAQIDQARREREEADRKQQQLLLSTRAQVCSWASFRGYDTFRSSSFKEYPIECGVKDSLSRFITRLKNTRSSNGWIAEGYHHLDYNEHEVLIGDMKGLIWVSFRGSFNVNSISYAPVPFGNKQVDSTDSFVARFYHAGGIHPASVSKGCKASGNVAIGNAEIVTAESYDVLCYRYA